ncbi:capsid portal protein [Macropodid alphaherpesvirus 4]|uniref:Capsid portal protein n=1 Tax=Macropodid alphaherpesvirus 4 TaxID=2762721 RepID=A0A7L7YUD8_9ALPH|nr:capsid portal protein [Macropodid alphaherpesvirus 4]QOD40135.1 capsid portal protein [Macropodid alphaherpesvirus 4]
MPPKITRPRRENAGFDRFPIGCVDDQWTQIHPTTTTLLFREVLLGEFGYTEGQGVYNVVRSSEAATRQLQATVFSVLLNAIAYQDLEVDWYAHLETRRLEPDRLAVKYYGAEGTNVVGVAERIFDTWRRTLQTTLLDFARGVSRCLTLGNPSSPTSFSKYIDWIVCLGIVPVLRMRREGTTTQRLRTFLEQHALPRQLTIVAGVVSRVAPILYTIASAIDASHIADYDRVRILYNFSRNTYVVQDLVTKKIGDCLVLWPPLWRSGQVIFDSPLQRIFHEVVACHSLREHSQICRLLNTAPIKVLLGRRSDGERGPVQAVRKALGEDDDSKAGSAAARLVRLIINMKSMRHVGDINDTIRAYLDETGGHLIDTNAIDPSLPGFGRGGRSTQGPGARQPQLQQAFQTSLVNNINGMLEGYINNLFGTIERLRETNTELATKLNDKERELYETKVARLDRAQQAVDAANVAEMGGPHPFHPPIPASTLDYEVIDVSKKMDDDMYVANSFQHPYVPVYNKDLDRLSNLWEHELLRCFKISRQTNNQGQETSISYSSGAIELFVVPYFTSVLQVPDVSAPITGSDVVLGEEELWDSIFQKTRLHPYLVDLAALFVADVRRASAHRDNMQHIPPYKDRTRSRSPVSHHNRSSVPNQSKHQICYHGPSPPRRR